MATNRGGFFNIDWEGLDELERMLDDVDGRIDQIALEEYRDFGALFEEAVRALMPRDESDLEGSYNVSSPVIAGGQFAIEGGTNSEYALRRHEEPAKTGKRDKYDNGSKFPDYYVNGRGARTRSKPGFRGEKAGRKYQERAVTLLKEDWDDTNKRILKRALSGRR